MAQYPHPNCAQNIAKISRIRNIRENRDMKSRLTLILCSSSSDYSIPTPFQLLCQLPPTGFFSTEPSPALLLTIHSSLLCSEEVPIPTTTMAKWWCLLATRPTQLLALVERSSPTFPKKKPSSLFCSQRGVYIKNFRCSFGNSSKDPMDA